MRESLLSILNITFGREFKLLSSARVRIMSMAGPSRSCGPAIRPRCWVAQIWLIIFLAFFSPVTAQSQWKELLELPDAPTSIIRTIYFLDLPGPPRIGFLGIQSDWGCFKKTTDGGHSWKDISLLPSNLGFTPDFPADITFKDSLTGWLAAIGSGCYKTTDGGDNWIFVGGGEGGADGIYYDKKTDGLFLSEGLGWDSVSWDEGLTWSGMTYNYFEEGGFAFSDDNNGILAGDDGVWASWCRTTDGGRTWSNLSIDSNAWQPLGIAGTQTYFANTFYGNILRTDDSWNTWREVYSFPSQPPTGIHMPSSSCIRGDIANLYVTVGSGCYRSTDQGVTWNYLCGQPSNVMIYQRFYVKDNYIYIASLDSTEGYNRLWMLDLDSMQYFNSKIESQFTNGAKQETIKAGDTTTVLFQPEMDSLVGVDSVHLVIRYDSNVLSELRYQIPAGWSVASSKLQPGLLDLWLVDTGAGPLPNPMLQVTFVSGLHPPTPSSGRGGGVVYLDSAHLYGKRLNCDCSALSTSQPDSVEVNFEGCGDSVLIHYMLTGQFTDGSKHISIQAGDTVSIFYHPEIDSLLSVDSVHLAIRYDSNALSLLHYQTPVGWSAASSISQPGLLDIWLVDTGGVPLPDPALQVTFGSALSASSTIVSLDSIHLYGRRVTCDYSTLSIAPPDSVEIDFTGCGYDLLLAEMQGTPIILNAHLTADPFSQQTSLSITTSREAYIHVEVFDMLGRQLPGVGYAGTFEPGTRDVPLDLSQAPSGTYYLRLSTANNETRTMKLSKE